MLRNAVEAPSDDSGWSNLAPVGSNVAKQAPEFDPCNDGYRKLGELIAASGLFEIEKRKSADGAGAVTMARRLRRGRRKGVDS